MYLRCGSTVVVGRRGCVGLRAVLRTVRLEIVLELEKNDWEVS